MSAIGTKRTSQVALHMSAFGGRADMSLALQNVKADRMTIGRNAVGYLTQGPHGAGSPQAQRIQIAPSMKIEEKNARARHRARSDRIEVVDFQ